MSTQPQDLKVSLNGRSYAIIGKQDRPIGVNTSGHGVTQNQTTNVSATQNAVPTLSGASLIQSTIVKKDVKSTPGVQLLKSENISFKPKQLIETTQPTQTYQLYASPSQQQFAQPQGTTTYLENVATVQPPPTTTTIIKEIRPNYEPFERDIQRLKQELEYFRQRFTDSENKLGATQSQYSVLQEQLRIKNFDNERLLGEVKRSQGVIQEQSQQILALSQRLSEREAEFENFKIAYTNDSKRIIDREIGAQTERFLVERRNFEVEMQRLRQEVDQAKLQATRSQAALQQIQGIDSENKRLRQELGEQREKYYQLEQALSQCKRLEADNRALRADIEQLQGRNVDLKNESLAARDVKAENRKLKDLLDQRTVELEERLRDLESLRRQSEANLRRSQKKLDSASKETSRALEDDLSRMRLLNEQLYQENEDLKAKLDSKEKLYLDASNEVNRLSAMLRTLQTKDDTLCC